MLYACLSANGIDIPPEESSSGDRSDLVVLHAGQVIVLELKVVLGLRAGGGGKRSDAAEA